MTEKASECFCILTVDPDSSEEELIRLNLGVEGFKVISCTGPQEVEPILEKAHPDLIIEADGAHPDNWWESSNPSVFVARYHGIPTIVYTNEDDFLARRIDAKMEEWYRRDGIPIIDIGLDNLLKEVLRWAR